MIYNVITPSITTPITVDEAKQYARVYRTDEDTLFEVLIQSSTSYAQVYTNRTYGVTQYKLELENFQRCIELQRTPFVSLDSFEYVDKDGNTQAVPPTDYTLVDSNPFQKIVFNDDYAFPETDESNPYPISITFTAGYTPAETPATVKVALLMLTTEQYEHRLKGEEFYLHENATFYEILNSDRLIIVI